MSAEAHKRKKSLTTILVKPAGPDCNLRCVYCFYLDRQELFSSSKVHRMTEELLEIMIRQAMEQTREYLTFGWQGGEPTLMGLNFFEKAVELQSRYHQGQTIGNGFQTNGILINEDWAKFFSRYKFLVGLSIDGPAHIHDYYRKTLGCQGSWEKVKDSAKLMLDKGVEVNALTVVNDYSGRFPEEIYQFHKELGLNYMQFIPCLEPDPVNPCQPAGFSVSAEQLGRFLVKLFDLWRADFKNGIPTTSIRFFDSLFFRYVGLEPPECTLQKECGTYLVVEHDGGVYSCDFFVQPDCYLGNIRQDRLIELLNSEKQIAFGKRKSDLSEECNQCKYLRYCYGGCPKERMLGKHNQLCLAYKMFFDHAHNELKALANEWKARQTQPRIVIPDASPRIGRNDPCPCGSGLKYKKCCGK